ncbi:hypothetical protein BS50DRAFT_574792 [Corynespora cassiicola Philippines]|uniref:P-loop containing nucleoside triphosphate hydrolase protein n=1 Tax=Corynespora cassiicola Philippines TaxID=1448308 RepID=A0A2T2NM62_CORCC|nr:hypothetical protein BS50DRAFT_574792 [Corynespora cassiicola Philippines]
MFNTRVFLVIGRPGTWKLSLLEEVVGELVGTYKCPKSGALTHGIWPTIIDEKQYLFVEIPEFGAADTNDVDNLKNVASCVRAFNKFTKITGVLFLHDCNEYWMSKQGLQTIRWLQCFCGPKFYDRITIITSRGDNRDLEKNTVTSSRGDRLKEEYFMPLTCPPAPLPGAGTLYHAFADYIRTEEDLEPLSEHEFQYNKRNAWIRASIARIYDDYPDIELPDIELQVTTEMKRGVRLLDTEAERTLSLKPYHTIIRANDRWAIVYKNGIDYSIEDWASSYARCLEIPTKVALLDATLKATAEGNANANDILEDFPYLRYWLRVLYAAALAYEQRKQDETVNMAVRVNELMDICSDMGDGLEDLVSLKLNREKMRDEA